MKKFLFLLIMILFMPIVVSAANYYSISNNISVGNVIFKDNIMTYYNYNNYTYNVYYNNQSVNSDIVIGANEKYNYYTVPEDVVISNAVFESGTRTYSIYLESITRGKVYCFINGMSPDEITNPYYYFDKKYCDDYLEIGGYYSSDDILLFYDGSSGKFFYDGDGNPISVNYSQSFYFPSLNDDGATYWVFTGTNNEGYNHQISPIFEEYLPPKFEFKCTPKTIKYGEKSVCTLYAKVTFDLDSVSFDLDLKEYKLLSSTFPTGINNKKGEKQYNLEITDDYSQDGDKFVLGVFEITGSKNQEYSNQVQVVNLDYVDLKAAAKYDNLEDPIEIIALAESKEEKNPVTSSLSIIIPIILFVMASLVLFINEKRKKKIKYQA